MGQSEPIFIVLIKDDGEARPKILALLIIQVTESFKDGPGFGAGLIRASSSVMPARSDWIILVLSTNSK